MKSAMLRTFEKYESLKRSTGPSLPMLRVSTHAKISNTVINRSSGSSTGDNFGGVFTIGTSKIGQNKIG